MSISSQHAQLSRIKTKYCALPRLAHRHTFSLCLQSLGVDILCWSFVFGCDWVKPSSTHAQHYSLEHLCKWREILDTTRIAFCQYFKKILQTCTSLVGPVLVWICEMFYSSVSELPWLSCYVGTTVRMAARSTGGHGSCCGMFSVNSPIALEVLLAVF